MTYSLSSFLWLVLIVALIPLTLWFVKRTPMGQGGAPGTPRPVAVLPLSGASEGRTWLVVAGVTALVLLLAGIVGLALIGCGRP